jgi:hypothetical protein
VLVSNDRPLLVVKADRMKTNHLLIVLLIGGGLALSVLPAQAKDSDDANINAANIPLSVVNAAESAVQGSKIVRWEKEGDNYEAVIEKDGKEWGYTFGPHGKWLGKHEEGKEKGEAG